MNPKVTVIVPTYNRVNDLKNCLQSLRNQSIERDAFEIIIIDDGSSDGTAELGKEILKNSSKEIRYFYQKNKGPASARNYGIREARGAIIAFIDDDCTAENLWLEALIRGYEEEAVGGTGGRIVSPLRKTLIDRYCAHKGLLETPKFNKAEIEYVVTANASFRKSVLENVGGFDESFPFPGGEDPELCFRIKKLGFRFKYNSNALVYHYHPRTLETMKRTFFNYGKGKALFLLKNNRGMASFTFEIVSLGWFFLLAFVNLPTYIRLTRGFEGFAYAFLDVYIRTIFRWGLIVGLFKFRKLSRGRKGSRQALG